MIDTSFLTGTPPPATPLLDPLTIQARKIAVRNALAAGALQDQQIQAGALANQQAQASYDQNQKFRARFNNGMTPAAAPAAPAPAPAPAPAMAPAPDVSAGVPPGGAALPAAPAYDASPGAAPTQMSGAAPAAAAPAVNAPQTAAHDIPDSQILEIFGQAGYSLIHARNEANKLAGEAQAAADTHTTAVKNYWGSTAYGLSGVNYDPGAVQAAIQKAQTDHMDGTPQFQQFVANANNPAALTQLGAIAMRQSPEQQTLLNERTTASAKASEAQTASDSHAQTTLDKKRADFLSALGAVPKGDNTTWSAVVASNPDLAKNLNIPPTYSSAAQAFAKAQGQSTNEQITSAQTAAHNAADESIQRTARNQEQQNINLRQQEFNQKYSPTAIAIAPADLPRIQAIHDGEIPAPSPRSAGFQKTMDQVYSLDKPGDAYTQARYTTVQNFKTKGDADRITNLGTAFAHLDRAQTNSQALGLSPTESLNWTPAQHDYHLDVDFLSGEVGKFVKNGELTQAEGDRIIGNLNSMRQGVRDSALNETRELMAGKFQGVRQKYANGTGRDLPLSMFTPAVQKTLVSNGFYTAPVSTPGAVPAPKPAAAPAAPLTATGPGGHKITSTDGGNTWLDPLTGKKVQ